MRSKTSRSGRHELRLLVALIVDKHTLSATAEKLGALKSKCWKSDHARLIAGWCIKHYLDHKEAPGPLIQEYFQNWMTDADPGVVKSVEKVLSLANEEHAKLEKKGGDYNSKYHIALANQYFSIVNAEKELEQAQEAIERMDLPAVLDHSRKVINLNIGECEEETVQFKEKDVDEILDANETKPLISYPGAFGDFLGGDLSRGHFFAIQAPEKGWKTFFLVDLTIQALRCRNRVAYFTLGDLNLKQTKERMMTRIIRSPKRTPRRPVFIPEGFDFHGGDKESGFVYGKERELDGWRKSEVLEKLTRFQKKFFGPNQDRFRLVEKAAGTLGIFDLEGMVHRWADEGFLVDVLVLDYADLMASPAGEKELRNATNTNWMGLRRISNELNCLVIVATQAKASASREWLMSRDHFSEDKRKMAHVTGMIGLNRNSQEKDLGVTRVNWIVRRNDSYNDKAPCYVAGALAMASPIMVSSFYEKEKETE